MKKVLVSLFMAVAMVLPVNAAEYSAANRVQEVGQNLLTKNGIILYGDLQHIFLMVLFACVF